VNALIVIHFRHEPKLGALPLITSKPFIIEIGDIPRSTT
jgi:hypothetical protein